MSLSIRLPSARPLSCREPKSHAQGLTGSATTSYCSSAPVSARRPVAIRNCSTCRYPARSARLSLSRRAPSLRGSFVSNGRRWSASLENNAQVDVSVPVEFAWDLWRDKTQIIKWMPWINRIEIVPDEPKQSKWVLRTEQFGREWELSWRALDLTPIKHQKIHWRSLAGSNSSGIEVPNRGQVRFYKKGPQACTVKLTIEYDVPGPLTPFASALTPLVESILQTDMNRFRSYATTLQQ